MKFSSISLVNATQWSQSITDKGIMYKSIRDPFSKLIVQPENGTKKLFRVPKSRTVTVVDNVVHFLGEVA